MNITYLIGAGASRETLPIVNEIPGRLKSTIELLRKNEFLISNSEDFKDVQGKTQLELLESLIGDLTWVLEKSENHASVDTFAKKLYIKSNRKELYKLKVAFSIYLIIEQTINQCDRRYDSFFASILNGEGEFPSNLKIMNWNYDFQFEKAYAEYSGSREVYVNQSRLNVTNKYSNSRHNNSEKFGIFKLNGTSTILEHNLNHYYYFDNFEDQLSKPFLQSLLRNYGVMQLSNQNLSPGLSFAWEGSYDKNRDIIQITKENTANTDILVVIGYSFPFFNREIDRDLIKNMTNLKKVYFQSPDAENIKERFWAIRTDIIGDNLKCRFDVGQFLLPDEM